MWDEEDGKENKNILVNNNLRIIFNLRGKKKPCMCSEWSVADLYRVRQHRNNHRLYLCKVW